jgi:L-2-hydroxyglutarate oxidase LhgO
LVPEVRATAGLFSPRTGILDAEGAARAFARRAREHGAQILTGARVDGLQPGAGGIWQVSVAAGDDGRRDGWRHDSRLVVNAAGLYAAEVAALAGIDVAARRWLPCPVKGNYFSLADRHSGRIDKLVYPVPPADRSSLGVHVCLDLGGRLRLGPDTETLIDPTAGQAETLPEVMAALEAAAVYAVDPDRGDAFFAGASRFLPWLRREDLTPDFAGIRPRLAPTGFQDFVVKGETGDLAGLINLVAIDSPGLTSAPALAGEVAAKAVEYLA